MRPSNENTLVIVIRLFPCSSADCDTVVHPSTNIRPSLNGTMKVNPPFIQQSLCLRGDIPGDEIVLPGKNELMLKLASNLNQKI